MHYNFTSNITLEPRLQEYIRKKKHYNQFDIKPSIPVEQEFNISHDDKKKIIKFFKSKEDLLKPHQLNNIQETDNLDLFFPSEFTRIDDPRVKKIINKTNDKLPKNMGMFAPNKHEKSCYTAQNNTPQKHSRHYKIPEIKYKTTIYNEPLDNTKNISNNNCHEENHNRSVNDIFNNLDKYSKHTSPEFTDVDNNYKLIKKNNYNKADSYNNKIPYLGYKRNNRNIDIETDIQQGLPSRLFTQKAKTHGYINPHEHYFDYISPDIQDPEHVVLPFPRGGFNTRLQNKQNNNNQITREIY